MAKPDPRLLEPNRFPFSLAIPTRFQDLDPNQHINNVAMAAIFEEMRVRFDHALAMQTIIRGHGLRAMLVSLQIEYLSEAFYPQPIEAHIGVLGIGRTSWTVAGLTRQGAATVSFMTGTVVCVDENRPAALPAPLRKALGAYAIKILD